MVTSQPVADLDLRELAVLAPLAVLMLVMGVVPNYWLRAIERSSHPVQLLQQVRVQPKADTTPPYAATEAQR
jgi:NADH:ubiquinone oxidoreductase subunit 4 (subunit M)